MFFLSFLKDFFGRGEYFDLVEDVIKSSDITSVVESGMLPYFVLDMAKHYTTSWHRSKEKRIDEHPFTSFMLNKKWTLEEEFNKHMLRFQQVRVSPIYFTKLIK